MKIDKSVLTQNPRIEKLIQLMLKESEEFGFNKRKNYRESIVCPVTVVLPNEGSRYNAFSKNLSASGLCIICETEVKPEKVATLEIYRDRKIESSLRASCVWSREFHGFYMSGWRFQKSKQDAFIQSSS